MAKHATNIFETFNYILRLIYGIPSSHIACTNLLDVVILAANKSCSLDIGPPKFTRVQPKPNCGWTYDV